MPARSRAPTWSIGASRRVFFGLLVLPPRPARAGVAAVALVCACESESSRQALEGARESLEKAGLVPEVFDTSRGSMPARSWKLVLALGREAVAAALTVRPACAIVSAMTSAAFAAESAPRRGTPAAVALDVPAAEFVAELKAVLPGRSRIGVVLNPAHPTGLGDGLILLAGRQSNAFHLVECPGPEQLLRAFLSLKGKAEVVVAVPAGTLFNGTTIKPLILASLENRLPIAGFSPSFVRAGAAVGIYPDFRELGRQAAELAARLLRGENPATVEAPRKLTVAVNHRVARLMGIEFGRPRHGEGVVFR